MQEQTSQQNHGNSNKKGDKSINLIIFIIKLFFQIIYAICNIPFKKKQGQEHSQIQEHQKKSNESNENNDRNKHLNDNKENLEETINQNNLNSNKENFINQQKQEEQEQQQENQIIIEQQQEQNQQQQEIKNLNEEHQLDDLNQNISNQQKEIPQIEQQSENLEMSGQIEYKYLKQETLDLLNEIANKSYKARNVEIQFQKFIGQVNNIQDTIKHYFGRSQSKFSKQIKQMKKEIIGHINIRGDGNCFYTSFIYQYLSLLLNDEKRKIQFINQIEELSANIECLNIKINQNKEIMKEFSWQFQQIKTKQQLLNQMSNPDYLFYLLSVIVFRNYFAHIYQHSDEYAQFGDLNIFADLMIWEQECNNNEILIAALIENLKLHLILYFIDIKNNSYEKKEYKPKQQSEGIKIEKIFLLLSPGHYQIAIPI